MILGPLLAAWLLGAALTGAALDYRFGIFNDEPGRPALPVVIGFVLVLWPLLLWMSWEDL